MRKQDVASIEGRAIRSYCVDTNPDMEKCFLRAIACGRACRVTKFAAAAGDVDVLLFPESAVRSRIDNETPRLHVAWLLFARFFGLRIAPASWLGDPSRPCIKFTAAKGRSLRLFLLPEFRETNSGSVELLEGVCTPGMGSWRIVPEGTVPPKGATVLSRFRESSKVIEGQVSMISFINKISLVDIKNSSDGVQRRGVVACKG